MNEAKRDDAIINKKKSTWKKKHQRLLINVNDERLNITLY